MLIDEVRSLAEFSWPRLNEIVDTLELVYIGVQLIWFVATPYLNVLLFVEILLPFSSEAHVATFGNRMKKFERTQPACYADHKTIRPSVTRTISYLVDRYTAYTKHSHNATAAEAAAILAAAPNSMLWWPSLCVPNGAKLNSNKPGIFCYFITGIGTDRTVLRFFEANYVFGH